jgi:branched-chain amino acid transport system substrate-binding protein
MRFKHLGPLATAAALLVLAACGGGNEDASTASSTAEDGPIRLGAALSETGRFAESAASMRCAYDLWEEQTNQGGGIEGRDVELIFYDDESLPDTARVLAERLINQDDVFMLLGPYSSGITAVMAAVSEREQVPLIGTIASDSSTWRERDLNWTFQAFASSDFDHRGFLEIAAEHGADRVAVLYEESPFSIAAKDWAVEQGGPELGIEVEPYGYQSDDLDFSSITQRIADSGVEAVSMGGYVAPGIQFTQSLIERGVALDGYQFIQAGDEATREGLGESISGIIGRTPWHPGLDTKGNAEFVETYTESCGEPPDYQAATAFATGQLTAAAIEAVGTDREAVREFLTTEAVDTVMGTYEVDDRLSQVGYQYAVTQWQDGENVLVGGPAVTDPQPVVWPKPAW